MKRQLLTSGLILCLGFFALISCTDNPSSADQEPPTLPPAESMQMNFSEFNEQNSQQGSAQIASASNFSRAVVTATVMKVIVDVNLAIPRALLKAAQNTDAELNGDGEWEWSFSKTEGEHNYSVNLIATREGDDTIQWNFYVTNSQLGINNELFFNGRTSADGTEGTWSYYNLQNPDEEEVSQIEWTVNGENDVQLKLEVTSDQNDRLGDYITYTFDGTTKAVVYYDASDDETIEMQLNTETHAGYIIAPNYNNGTKACWNSNFQDIACEEI